MPEAAMDEEARAVAGEDQIRSPRQVAAMQTEPETAGMQSFPQNKFRLRVPASDPRHHARPGRGINGINHVSGYSS
jgi:hypothetical protein